MDFEDTYIMNNAIDPGKSTFFSNSYFLKLLTLNSVLRDLKTIKRGTNSEILASN